MRQVKLIKGEAYPIFSIEELKYPYVKPSEALPKHLQDVVVGISDEKLKDWQRIVKQYLDLQDHLEKIWKSQGQT